MKFDTCRFHIVGERERERERPGCSWEVSHILGPLPSSFATPS